MLGVINAELRGKKLSSKTDVLGNPKETSFVLE